MTLYSCIIAHVNANPCDWHAYPSTMRATLEKHLTVCGHTVRIICDPALADDEWYFTIAPPEHGTLTDANPDLINLLGGDV